MADMNWQHRTLIIPIALAEPARAACMACAGNGVESMFTRKLSATGEEPATHACSSGLIAGEFADLLPLYGVREGDAAALAVLATAGGVDLTEQQVADLLAACHIVDDGGHPYETFAELGLSLIED